MEYIPQIGGEIDVRIASQFPNSKISLISLGATPVFSLSNDGNLSTISNSSGFFWRKKSIVFFITARHVVSGRNPFTNYIMSKDGYIPEFFKIYPFSKLKNCRIECLVGCAGGIKWYQDQEFDELKTDIAAVELPLDSLVDVYCVNDQKFNDDIADFSGSECAIVGYPNKNISGLMTPIWRTGTIASEPLLPIDGKPMFLIDASTSPGFSGSPVFRQQFGPLPLHSSDGRINLEFGNIVSYKFVGVYAGRLVNQYIGGEIPFVFYANRIEHILPK